MCFRKKTPASQNQTDRDQISVNARKVDVLIAECPEADKEFIEKLKKLKEKMTFLRPSPNAKCIAADKKIESRLDDLKIALVKSKEENASDRAESVLHDVIVLVEQRNTLV